MQTEIDRKKIRRRSRYRIRAKLAGTAECPRLAVFRSAKHIYVQAVDDAQGRTLAQASTRDKALHGELKKAGNVEAAKRVGGLIAERLTQQGVGRVVFDRGGFVYHGRIRALAEAAREGGLKF